ncbi:phosphodiester glycosidase family protein [Pedobacter arcticus]|uniref:phosphodiester glycosidase family protein n=1 Tax=Pedobacter arcticus TaxID=752140 RepID=UPI00058F03C0|nr:phosphodiester glycosidase family protein [Pedobacter arcticus]
MKKKYLLSIAMCFICLYSYAQYTLVSTKRISPGAVYKQYTSTSPALKISLMEISLSEPTIKLQVVKSAGVINGDTQTVSTMYSTHDNIKYHDVVAGINGDFFTSTSTYQNPRHMLIGDGEILWDTVRNQSVFGITEGNIPFIEKLTENYSVKAGVSTFPFNQINRNRGLNQMVMYNRFYGNTTKTSAGGTEIKIIPVAGKEGWKANAIVSCKVLAKSSAGNMSFLDGEAVLSGLGVAKSFLDNLNVNDIISLDLNVLSASKGISDIKQLTGGYPKIVSNGTNYATAGMADEGSPAGTVAAPRTAIGYNQAKNKIYWAVIDGRAPGVSEGVTLSELADFMIFAGCYQSLNLDGGGSSSMVANGEVKNNPSDGSERLISNSILAYLTTLTLDDFEDGVGHFNRAPTYDPATVGVSTSSVAVPALTAHSGNNSLIVKLYDDPTTTASWYVRLLSGSGNPAYNRYFSGQGTISFWLKTSTAGTNPKVRIRLDDNDGTEVSPILNIINDGDWHKYTWSLSNFNGSSTDGGNGILNSTGARLDAIEFTQNNTSNTWFIFLDDIMVDKNSVQSTQIQTIKNQPLTLEKSAILPSSISIYPNPAKDNITIALNDSNIKKFEVEIFNMMGESVLKDTYIGSKTTIATNKLNEGVYVLHLKSKNTTQTFKLLIQ